MAQDRDDAVSMSALSMSMQPTGMTPAGGPSGGTGGGADSVTVRLQRSEDIIKSLQKLLDAERRRTKEVREYSLEAFGVKVACMSLYLISTLLPHGPPALIPILHPLTVDPHRQEPHTRPSCTSARSCSRSSASASRRSALRGRLWSNPGGLLLEGPPGLHLQGGSRVV